MGDTSLGLATGSERMFEKDMTPAARLGVCYGRTRSAKVNPAWRGLGLTLGAPGVLEDGAGDSVRARAGNATDDAPFVAGLEVGACRMLGDAILGGLADGLIDPAAAVGWDWETGLRGGNVDVAGDA